MKPSFLSIVYIFRSMMEFDLNASNDMDFSISNEELLNLCKKQDQNALRLLLRRHERPIYGMLFKMLSNREDAEEALAEVFVKVWRGAANFKGDSKFTTWLYRIATNTARDRLRARKNRQETYLEDIVIDESQYASSNIGNPEKSAMAAEGKAQIVKAMQQLAEEDRLLITLYHFQECDYNEIIAITGIQPQNLKVKLFRARQRLKKLCESQEKKDSDKDELRKNTTESSGLRQRTTEWA